MNVLVVGAFGHLGQDVVKSLAAKKYHVTAAGRTVRSTYKSDLIKTRQCDITNIDDVKNICKGMDIVISCAGLTKSSKTVTHYDVDYQGNLNILNDALKNKVKKFIYISVIKSDSDKQIPMLDAKNKFEEELKKSSIDYTILRPTGYFYDIANVFKPMIEKGKVTLLKGKKIYSNVIDTKDLADYIVSSLNTNSKNTIDIGGQDTYCYDEIAEMFFNAAHKKSCIKYVSPKLFDIIAFVSKITKNGRYANVLFGKWTMMNDMEAETKVGTHHLNEYIKSIYS